MTTMKVNVAVRLLSFGESVAEEHVYLALPNFEPDDESRRQEPVVLPQCTVGDHVIESPQPAILFR